MEEGAAGEGGPGDADEDDQQEHELHEVLPLDATQHHRLLGQVGAGGVELLADQGVVAGGDEEGQLRYLGRAGDLDGAGALSGLGQQQALGVEGADEKVRRRLLADHLARHLGRIGELVVGQVGDGKIFGQ